MKRLHYSIETRRRNDGNFRTLQTLRRDLIRQVAQRVAGSS